MLNDRDYMRNLGSRPKRDPVPPVSAEVEAGYSRWLLSLDRDQLGDHVDYLAERAEFHSDMPEGKAARFYSASLEMALAAGRLNALLDDLRTVIGEVPGVDPDVFVSAFYDLARLNRQVGVHGDPAGDWVPLQDEREIFNGALEVALRRNTNTERTEG